MIGVLACSETRIKDDGVQLTEDTEDTSEPSDQLILGTPLTLLTQKTPRLGNWTLAMTQRSTITIRMTTVTAILNMMATVTMRMMRSALQMKCLQWHQR